MDRIDFDIVNKKDASSKRCACWHWCCCCHMEEKGLLYSHLYPDNLITN